MIYRDQNLHKTDTFLCHKHLLSFQKSININYEINNHFVIINDNNGKVVLKLFNNLIKESEKVYKIWEHFIEIFVCSGKKEKINGIIMFKNMKKYNIVKGKILFLDSETVFMNQDYYNIFYVVIYKLFNVVFGNDSKNSSIVKMINQEYTQYKTIIQKAYDFLNLKTNDKDYGYYDQQFDKLILLSQKLLFYNKSVLKRIFNIIISIPLLLQKSIISNYDEISQISKLLKISQEILNESTYNFTLAVFLYNELVFVLFKFINIFIISNTDFTNTKENLAITRKTVTDSSTLH